MSGVRDIKAAVSLVVIASEYGELRKSGAQWLMLCPWHHEQRPSLRVYQDHVYCFTCQASGDVVDLVAQCEGISKGRAIKLLSDRTGIPIDGGRRRTPIQRAGDRQDLDFALWWHSRQVTQLSKQLTAYCIHATEQDCEDLGGVLRQLRSLDRQAIVGAARRLGTAEDWKEWESIRAEQRWFEGFWLSLATLPYTPLEPIRVDASLDPFEIVRRFGGAFYRSLLDNAIRVPSSC